MGITKEVKELRTKQINDFMSQFDSLKETDTTMISADEIINEDTGETEVIKDIKKIHIYYTYTDEEEDLRVSKISYIVD
jgi:hypothetical protein